MDKKYINPMISSMAGRLGIYNGTPKVDDPTLNIQDSVNTAIDGVHQQSSLLNLYGGHAQQERMIQDKKRSLDRALRYSYQGATVRNIEGEETYRALINPNKVKLDYDEKVISINWDAQFKPGTVFEWQGTNTYWLILYQDLTELAYFKGDCRKCHYTIQWADKETAEIFKTYASIIGPKESIQSKLKDGAAIDEPNYSLNILIPQTQETLNYFQRYTKFYFQSYLIQDAPITCWQVVSADWISTPGVIQIVAKEDYINPDLDNVGEIPDYKQIKAEAEKKQQLADETAQLGDDGIVGENFIYPVVAEYTYNCKAKGEWSWEGTSCPITIVNKTDNSITLKWNQSFGGSFILRKGASVKTIEVRSLYE